MVRFCEEMRTSIAGRLVEPRVGLDYAP